MKTNIIYNQDCLDLMKSLPKESIDLIYIDPPFFTQQDFGQFTDKWDSSNSYLDYMKVRLIEMHRLLKETGSFYLHCDYRTNYKFRVLLNDIFGEGNFINEIIWHYGMRQQININHFNRKHDSIYFYSKTKEYNFTMQYIPYTQSYLNLFCNEDENGFYLSSYAGKGKPRYKRYLKESKGMALDTVWDITSLCDMKKHLERTKYPTQKPLALLDRIIKASSKEGDLVADFFCGSGTTLHSAYNNNRQYIGCDINKNAIKIANKRLQQLSLYDNKE